MYKKKITVWHLKCQIWHLSSVTIKLSEKLLKPESKTMKKNFEFLCYPPKICVRFVTLGQDKEGPNLNWTISKINLFLFLLFLLPLPRSLFFSDSLLPSFSYFMVIFHENSQLPVAFVMSLCVKQGTQNEFLMEIPSKREAFRVTVTHNSVMIASNFHLNEYYSFFFARKICY